MKKRWIVGIIFLVLVTGVTIAVLNKPERNKVPTSQTTPGTVQQTSVPQTTLLPEIEAFPSEWDQMGVVAKGEVQPVRFVRVKIDISGRVKDLLVKPGDIVEEGDTLIRLDDRTMLLDVETAEIALEKAKLEYRALQQGPEPANVAIAEAKIRTKEAELIEAQNEVLPIDIEAANARIGYRRLALAELDTLPKETTVRALQARYDRSIDSLDLVTSEYANKKEWATKEIERKANEVRNAQDNYSAIYWDNQKQKLDRESQEWMDRKNLEERALREVKNSEIALEQAKITLQEYQEVERFSIAIGESTVRENQALLEEGRVPPTEVDYATLRFQLVEAEAQLAVLNSPKRVAMLERMDAQRDLAYAEFDQVTAPPRDIDLALKEIDIREKEVYLKESRLKLEQATIHAPINGTVAEVTIKEGELYDIYRDNHVISLADLTEWEVRTSNVADTEVVRIDTSKPAIVTFDAMPDVSLSGHVKRIEHIGEASGGHVVYRVIVGLDDWNDKIRWMMPATVMFATVD